jgi:hypothetical protein
MKNQYFGDNRDLFKYDLITEIIKGTPTIKKLAFIPMLTPNDSSNHGEVRKIKKDKAGYKNGYLKDFLEPTHPMDKNQRDFRSIKEYFNRVGILVDIYNHNKDPFFTHSERDSYFKNIGSDFLKNALVFVDPDIGLEVKDSDERHILYSELGDLFKKSNRIVMVFQYIPPYRKRDSYIKLRLSNLRRITYNLAYIADNHVIFFFLCNFLCLSGFLKQEILNRYAETYPQLIFG